MSSPDITDVEVAAVVAVLRHGSLSLGPRLVEFEQAIADYIGVKHAVGVSSGTAGLHLAVLAADVGPGDLVITTPFSFVASSNCLLYAGAEPLFVDVDPTTGNIDADLIESVIEGRSDRDRIKAILPVHVFGQPADMDAISEIAHRHRLVVIEDACEAIGAEYKGRRAGTLADAAVFGFYPNKQITTAEGGMIVTNRDDWANRFRSQRNQGRDSMAAWLQHERLGYNYRLNELSAALGVAQMSRIEELLAARDQVARWYDARLALVRGVELLSIVPSTTKMSWFAYVLRFSAGVNRDRVMAELADYGIPSRTYFTPIHLQPFYMSAFGYGRGDFPVAEALGDACLALPFSATMTEDEVDRVCSSLAAVLSGSRPAIADAQAVTA